MPDLMQTLTALGGTTLPAVMMANETLAGRHVQRVLAGSVALACHGVHRDGPVTFLVGEEGLDYRGEDYRPAAGLPMGLGDTRIAYHPIPSVLSEQELAEVMDGVPVARPGALAWLALLDGDAAMPGQLRDAGVPARDMLDWVQRYGPEQLEALRAALG